MHFIYSDSYCRSPKGTLGEKKVVRIAISFERIIISFERIIISFERIIVSRERNNISRERNIISRERNSNSHYFCFLPMSLWGFRNTSS